MQLTVLLAGSKRTHPLPLLGQVTIGRGEDNNIRLDDSSVSRRHARLHMGPPLRIEDVGSANGIRVTTHRASTGTVELLEARVPPRGSLQVSEGERIVIGATILVVQYARGSDDDSEPSSSRIVRAFVSPVIEDGAMRELYEMARRVAQSPINVLLLGETGVGKEVMAEAIHRSSERAQGPLVCINCASLLESLLETRMGEDERKRIVRALDQCAGNQTQAAELLGMSRRTLVSRLSAYGISRPHKKR